MRIPPAARSVPKAGRFPDENEDAYALNPAVGRYAVADGVSTAARPEVWSSLLVQAFAEGSDNVFDAAALHGLAEQWRAQTIGPDLPWYAQEKLSQGSSATFLGLRVDHASGEFSAEAVGDTCLFHVRGPRLLCSYPLTDSRDFTNTPAQLSTTARRQPSPARLFGHARPWDQLVLATDAMSKFLLLVHERRRQFPALIDLVTGSHFAEYVELHRSLQRLDNDDTTLCVVTV